MEHDDITAEYLTELISTLDNEPSLEFSVEDIRGSMIFYTFYTAEEWDLVGTHTVFSTLEDAADIMQATQPLEDVDFEEVLNVICLGIDGDSFHVTKDEELILIRGASVMVTITEESTGSVRYAI